MGPRACLNHGHQHSFLAEVTNDQVRVACNRIFWVLISLPMGQQWKIWWNQFSWPWSVMAVNQQHVHIWTNKRRNGLPKEFPWCLSKTGPSSVPPAICRFLEPFWKVLLRPWHAAMPRAIFSEKGLRSLGSRLWIFEWSAILNWITLLLGASLMARARKADRKHQAAVEQIQLISALRHVDRLEKSRDVKGHHDSIQALILDEVRFLFDTGRACPPKWGRQSVTFGESTRSTSFMGPLEEPGPLLTDLIWFDDVSILELVLRK